MDNIFTQEEIRFLQRLYKQSGLAYVRYDQKPLEMFSYPNLDPELVAIEAEETFSDTLFPEVNTK